jgi:hypothetical protein
VVEGALANDGIHFSAIEKISKEYYMQLMMGA